MSTLQINKTKVKVDQLLERVKRFRVWKLEFLDIAQLKQRLINLPNLYPIMELEVFQLQDLQEEFLAHQQVNSH